eukprot:CAMPEP_0170512268 /NCGR_PEP_ID=MMETSP0208-20121228/66757_1 /TAXON_ID=197538 /ORGANISM="Strombidium inclinatum, Strain S3" /LENGTH=109 /DNA_ID=CAMNT_0010795887 /DNA_START=2182 /DNA_END=2511 /DNA_ORIENTATION=+
MNQLDMMDRRQSSPTPPCNRKAAAFTDNPLQAPKKHETSSKIQLNLLSPPKPSKHKSPMQKKKSSSYTVAARMLNLSKSGLHWADEVKDPLLKNQIETVYGGEQDESNL